MNLVATFFIRSIFVQTASAMLLTYILIASPCHAKAPQTPSPGDGSAPPASRLPKPIGELRVDVHVTGRPFAEIMDSLARKCNISFIVEDLPRKVAGDMEYSGPLQDAIDRLGDVFDLDWRVSKRGIILFVKRFRDPNEHPQVIHSELNRVALDVNAVFKVIPYEPDGIPWHHQVRTLYQSLNEDQLRRLNNKEKLTPADLSAPQQRQMLQTLYSNGFGETISAWRLFAQQLQGMGNSALGIRTLDRADLLVYLYPVGQPSQRIQPLQPARQIRTEAPRQ